MAHRRCRDFGGRSGARIPCGSPPGPGSGGLGVQGGDADEVVDRSGPQEPDSVALQADVAQLASAGDRLHPAEGFLDSFADAQAGHVAVVPSGPSVDGAAPVAGVLGHVRGHLQGAAAGDEARRVEPLSPPTVRRRARAGSRASRVSAVSRSAYPVAEVSSMSAISALRFSMRRWPASLSLAATPLPLRARRASGSVVEWWVSLLRFSPWSSTSAFRPGAGGPPLPPPSLGRKLLCEAQASSRVPSTLKCSPEM